MSTSKSDFVSRKKQDQFVSDDSGNFTASVFTDGDGSHVTMLSPRVDPATSVGGLTEDGCYTSAVSLSDYLTAPSSPRNSVEPNESYLKAIFDNFNELYQDKMAWIDENIPETESHSHVMAKKNVLEHWVKDVIEQNNILVQTVEELEAEAEKKVQVLQKKVYESADLAKEHMGMIKEYEDQIKQLIKEKHSVEKQEEFFRKESMYLEKEKRRALDRMHTLENDNSSLVTLMNRIRDMGVWDINGLNFAPRTYDCIFGLYPNLAGSEVQTVFTREKARNLEKSENNVAQLMAQVEELHGRKNEAERLLTEKTKVTEDLQNDIKDLNVKIKQYQDEHQEFKQSLKETQDQLKAATLKNQSRPSTGDTKRESEMKEMLGELRDLRNQLNIACSERQQAMKESNQLKTELKGRIVQMEDMKCLLDQIQTEAASTRNAVLDVQDKQGQMSSLKEKVNFYQTSYENSNVLLEAKSEIITRLQNQMDQLHDKVAKLEKSRSCSPNPVATSTPPARSPSRSPSLPASHPYSPRPSHPDLGSRPASTSHQSCRGRAHSHLPSQTITIALNSAKKSKPKELRKATVKVNKKGSITTKPSKTESAKGHEGSKKHSSSYYSKPPWNDHFVRSKKLSSSPRTGPDKPKSQSQLHIIQPNKYSAETKTASSIKTTVQMHKNDSSPPRRLNTFDIDKTDEKRIYTETSKIHSGSATNDNLHAPVNRIIADYLGQSDISGKNSSATDSKKASKQQQRTLERVKLPPIPTKTDTSPSVQTPTSKTYEKTLEEHLPRIIVKERKAQSSGMEALENLMEVCVKASRELNRQSDLEGKSSQKYRVVTGHTHRRHTNRSRENTYTVESLPKSKGVKAEREAGTGLGLSKPAAAVYLNRTAGDSKQQSIINNSNNNSNSNNNNNSKNKLSNKPREVANKPETESETLSNISQFRRVANHPAQKSSPTTPFSDERSPASILAELPKESNDYLVKKWIVNSPSPSKKIRKPRSTSPNKSLSNIHSLSDRYRPDSRGKSKSTGPANLKMLAFDDWSRKQDITHSDATGDRDSGHLSDFSDCWNWNGNEDEDKEIHMPPQNISEISSGLESYETLCSPDHSHSHPDLERFQQLLIENQRLREEKLELEQLNTHLELNKLQITEDHKKEIELKDVEITMQKGQLISSSGNEHEHRNTPKAVGARVEENILLTRQSCANLHDKVMDTSRELTCIKNLTENLRVKSTMLEKDDLLYKSYVLLGQVEQDHKSYFDGHGNDKDNDGNGDWCGYSEADVALSMPAQLPMIGSMDVHVVNSQRDDHPNVIDHPNASWTTFFQMELRQIREFAVAVNAQAQEKISQVGHLQQETEEVQRMVEVLSKNFRDIISDLNSKNGKLIEKIEQLEKKQAQMDEVLRMESEIQRMHVDIQEYDSGVLLTEKRLGVIQNSYDKLSHELIRRDELISQRDAKIAELETHIRDSDILNQSNSDHGYNYSLSNNFDFDSSFPVPISSENLSTTNQISDVTKIGKLIWLVAALKKKLKKKKEREDYVTKEKEILMSLFSNMNSTWDGLRFGCEQVRLENEQLKKQLGLQGTGNSRAVLQTPIRTSRSIHPHCTQASGLCNQHEEGDGDKTCNELSPENQSQTQGMNIPRVNTDSGISCGRILYPVHAHTDCSLKFPQSSHAKGLSESYIRHSHPHQQQNLPTCAKVPGNRGVLTVTPRNTNNSTLPSPIPIQITSNSTSPTANIDEEKESYSISSINGVQNSTLFQSSDQTSDISFLSPPKYLELESKDSFVDMSSNQSVTVVPTLQLLEREEEAESSDLQELVQLWEECYAKTRHVLKLGDCRLSLPVQSSNLSFQQTEQ